MNDKPDLDDPATWIESARYWESIAENHVDFGNLEDVNATASMAAVHAQIAIALQGARTEPPTVSDAKALITAEIDHTANRKDHTDPARTIIQELKATFLRWRSEYASMSRDKTNTEELMSTCDRLANMASHAAFLTELALRDLDNTDLKSH